MAIALVPLRALGLVHPPVNRVERWLFGFSLNLFDESFAEQCDLLALPD